jgi:Flp pilus assembly protein TadB
VSAVALVGGAVLGVGGGVLGRDWWLGRQVARRQARMLRELPTLADLLCLAVTAGEGPRAALERRSPARVASSAASWRWSSPTYGRGSRS